MKYAIGDRKKKILELNSRKKIFEVVKKNAGSHFREIERRSGISHGTLKYHLGFLVRHGLILENKEGNNLRYFPTEFKNENKILLGLLRQKQIRKIVLFILLNKKCSSDEIIKFLGLAPSTVSWHLKKLIKERVISAQVKGKKKEYSLLIKEEDIIKLLIIYKESFFDSLVDRVVETWEK